LQVGTEQDKISIDRLKPAYLDPSKPPQVAQPPRRGRPPKKPSPEVPSPEVPSPGIPSPGVPSPEVSSPEVPCPEVLTRPAAPSGFSAIPTPRPVPTYAEVLTRRGRVIRPPRRYRN
jgi:hypothetical protein